MSDDQQERRSRALAEEAILQITPYGGVPRAVNAIAELRDEQEIR